MRKLTFVLFFVIPLFAGPSLNGYVETYSRYLYSSDSSRWTWNDVGLDVKLEGAYGDYLHYYSEVRLRSLGFPSVVSLGDLGRREKDRVSPWILELREAYCDIYGFLHPALDLRIGKQEIVWGTADKINPTSNLSPYDLEDFFNFGEKLGVNALRATLNLEPLTVEADFIPVFTPSTLPPPEYSSAFWDFSSSGLSFANLKDTVALPGRNVKDASEFAFKISSTVLDYDLSLSYFHGYDGFPIPQYLEVFQSGSSFYGKLTLTYPRVDVVGADFAGSLFGLGLWGEGALFIPEDFTFRTKIMSSMGPVETVDTLLRNSEPYFKFVLGTDYTFKNGLYVNVQFVRGFLHERGSDSLSYYIFARGEKSLFNDKLKVAPLGVALTVKDFEDIEENYGAAWLPEITYYPHDNIELHLGALLIEGKGDNIFARMKKKDEVFFRVRLTF